MVMLVAFAGCYAKTDTALFNQPLPTTTNKLEIILLVAPVRQSFTNKFVVYCNIKAHQQGENSRRGKERPKNARK